MQAGPAARDLTLPADVRGFFQSTVYAKVAGYVKSMNVDKGDQVKAGQLLGVLESPEVDQQVAAAEADLLIKKRTLERYALLVKKDFVSKQDFETARAQYEVSRATLAQARALQSYESLRAPFAGTITARYVDPGALVPAATGSTQSAAPLVDIADLRRLRILVFVQQDAAPFVHAGDRAHIARRPAARSAASTRRSAAAPRRWIRARAPCCARSGSTTSIACMPGTFVHVTLSLKAPRSPVVDSSARAAARRQAGGGRGARLARALRAGARGPRRREDGADHRGAARRRGRSRWRCRRRSPRAR